MKKIGFYLLFIGLLLFLGSIEDTTARATQLDATSHSIFKEHALVPNDSSDQSAKLQYLLKITAEQGDALFIPKGSYIINQSIDITSNMQVIGDKSGASVFKSTSKTPVSFQDQKYAKSNHIAFKNLYFDGVNIFARLVDEMQLENNVFYNLMTKYPIELSVVNQAQIKNNLFMRDYTHSKPAEDYNRMIYVGGYSTNSRYEYMQDLTVIDNLFGLKLNELDAIKSFSRSDVIETIKHLQNSIEKQEVDIHGGNEQNYFSTGINSYSMLKGALIRNNLFYQSYDNEDTHEVTGDHATYLRGAQDVQLISNHLRGLANGPAGGFKFKSGRNITIMNNYLRNTGIIMYGTPEYGLGQSYKEGPISELSNWLVSGNQFDWKYWQEKYAIGIEYNQHTGNDHVANGVFIDNKFTHYENIPANKRRGLLIASDTGGFRGENTFVSGNTRDDRLDGKLTPEKWGENDFSSMPISFDDLIPSKQLDQYHLYKDASIPVRNTLPIAKTGITISSGDQISPYDFVEQLNDKDEAKPKAEILNPEVLDQHGNQKVYIQLSYKDQSAVLVGVEVTIK
ncbi:glycosyl hydrolase family 28-related protein [Listeria sp. PSOL-1]|uniref:glycosyl hydrolase family 28-related protein n=1 Tax=Listeria sp. PSOL-1 TaxID=1844999 RepID=UPI0013D0E992|nr:glycosyl hydrolase family 28-related protein [Listeria sp. PSOL-1]